MKAQLLEDIGDSLPPAPPQPAQATTPQDTEVWTPAPPLSDPCPSDAAPTWSAAAAPAYAPPEDTPDWFDRWGRRAAAGTAILLATLAVSGAGLWLYKESKVDQSLSVLAKAPIPARRPLPAPAAHATQLPPEADLPPRVADLPPPQADNQEAAPAIAAAPETIRKRAPTPLSRAAAAAPMQPKARSGSGKPGRTAPLAETLRLCRAAGYHAAKCVQLDCTATQYGLACKGARNVRR